MTATRELLRRIAAHDEHCLQTLLSAAPTGAPDQCDPGLDRGTRLLVELAALMAVGAETTSLRWAVDRAAAVGTDDTTLVEVLVAAGAAAGAAQTALAAPRLALAIDLDLDRGACDGAGARAPRRRRAPALSSGRPPVTAKAG